MNITLDKNLVLLRAEKGVTQDRLAAFLGVTHQTVSKWERGENLPDLTLLPAIASFFDVTVDNLLGVGEIRKKEKIYSHAEKARKLLEEGKTAEAVAV